MLIGNNNYGEYLMDNACKEAERLSEELVSLRRKVAELKRLEEEHKRMEKSLYESERKHRSLVENVRFGVFRSTLGEKGRFLEVKPAMEKITGYTRDELLKISVSDLYVYPEERETVLEEAAQITG